MRILFTISAMALAATSNATEPTFLVNGKQSTPIEATMAAIQNKDAKVLKCTEMVIKANKAGTVGLTKKD